MNHLTATYIDFIQTIGVLMIFGVAAYSVKQILLKAEQRIEPVDMRVEEWACSIPIYWLMAAWCLWACHCYWFGKAEKKLSYDQAWAELWRRLVWRGRRKCQGAWSRRRRSCLLPCRGVKASALLTGQKRWRLCSTPCSRLSSGTTSLSSNHHHHWSLLRRRYLHQYWQREDSTGLYWYSRAKRKKSWSHPSESRQGLPQWISGWRGGRD